MFGRACLVNASFNGTDCGPYQGQPASFVSACLQGTDFTDASLDGADLSGAAVAAAPDKDIDDILMYVNGDKPGKTKKNKKNKK